MKRQQEKHKGSDSKRNRKEKTARETEMKRQQEKQKGRDSKRSRKE